MQAVTDGEYRRDWWHIDFLSNFEGVTLDKGDAYGDAKFKGTEEQPPFMRVTSKIRRTRPSNALNHFKFPQEVREKHAKFTYAFAAMLHAARRPRPRVIENLRRHRRNNLGGYSRRTYQLRRRRP